MARNLGQAFNGLKYISVELAAGGEGYRRLTGAISQVALDAAFEKVKSAFEGQKLFKASDMQKMEKLVIKNMTHISGKDPNAHYSVVGEDGAGSTVNDGHVMEDESKQTQSS